MLWLVWQVALANTTVTEVDVLQNIKQHPEWVLAQTVVVSADGNAMMSAAPFTPNITGQYSGYDEYYRRQIGVHQASIRTPLGVEVNAGWTQGIGDFPDYDGRYTVDQGEVTMGVAIPLLEGLWRNEERSQWVIADLERMVAEQTQRQQQLELVTAALLQYWKWRKAMSIESIYLQNLKLAEKRQATFAQQYQVGVRSRLSLIDNEREVHERQQQYLEAVQTRQAEALKLSYYMRHSDGMMMDLDDWSGEQAWSIDVLDTTPLSLDVSLRPDIQIWQWVDEQVATEQQWIQAKRLPKVNLTVQQNRPLAAGETEYGVPENYVGLKYEYAPMLKAERGKLLMIDAKRTAISLYQSKATDKAFQDARTFQQGMLRLEEQITAQQAAVALAEEALRLENVRFDKGGSDLLDLFKRESNLLKAQETLVKLKTAHNIQRVMLQTAIGRFPFQE